jgi:hypothetical protein
MRHPAVPQFSGGGYVPHFVTVLYCGELLMIHSIAAAELSVFQSGLSSSHTDVRQHVLNDPQGVQLG